MNEGRSWLFIVSIALLCFGYLAVGLWRIFYESFLLGFRRVVLGFSVVLKDCFWVYFMVFLWKFSEFFWEGFGEEDDREKGKIWKQWGRGWEDFLGVLSLLAFKGVSLFYGKILVSRGESVLECGLAVNGRAG